MTLIHVFVFILLALIAGSQVSPNRRLGFLFLGSVLALYWMQPATPLRNFDFWLPTATIAITMLVWFRLHTNSDGMDREDRTALALVVLITLAIAATRYLPSAFRLTSSLPPQVHTVILTLILIIGLIGITRFVGRGGDKLLIVLILILFIVMKTEPLALYFNRILRTLSRQNPMLANRLDLPWLGFSYLAFRLLHTLRDRAGNRLPAMTLREHVAYVLFFPTLSAGPIDRAERFVKDLREPPVLDAERFFAGGERIAIGLLKKFVLADSLAIIALNEINAGQVTSSLWLWLLLYAFAFQIYLDFSGYTDVAIGIGILAGINLPENFDRPYLQKSISDFWNRWHMTLAQWFRFYFFNPLTRVLRGAQREIPIWSLILVGQVGTMALIGLWHGISLNYLVWGVWHGIGLFIHNRWVAWLRSHPYVLGTVREHKALRVASTFLTFQFVVLGWVWFALPNVEISWRVFRSLFGL
ncbi:MAG: hypothetical protein GTO14_02915 [Anaerolineales bacterium]|nr:hypothetical protein [Anaerolineales bacterium]